MEKLTLYTYSRSSAAYRVRIALNLKDLDYTPEYIHLLKDGGQEKSAAFTELNPQKLVPVIKLDEHVITQSLAIIEMLEERHPLPPLLPLSLIERAHVRSLAYSITCEIHPLNNLRVLGYLKENFAMSDTQKEQWYCHWIDEGFTAIETRLKNTNNNAPFCFGDHPTLADICLIPQVYNASRFNCRPAKYPIISRIYENCMNIAAFEQASPELQSDFEPV